MAANYYLDVNGVEALIKKTVSHDILPYAEISVTYTSGATDLDGSSGKYKIASSTNYYNTNSANPGTGTALTSSVAWGSSSNVASFIKRITESCVRLIFTSAGWNALTGDSASANVGVDLQYNGQTGSTVRYTSQEIETSTGAIYFTLTCTMTSSTITWGTLKIHGHKAIDLSYINTQLGITS